ncbi:MAG TPA: hypothetical protein VF062_21115, partial [Candidatus Limnocylindrales bacterium]
MPHRPRVLLAMDPATAPFVFTQRTRAALEKIADLHGVLADDFGRAEIQAALLEAEVLFTGWGCPPVDKSVLERAPKLRAIVHT